MRDGPYPDPPESSDHAPKQMAGQSVGYGLPPLLTVAETAQFLRVGKSQLYERLQSDPDLRGIYVRWGRSYRIIRDRLLVLIEGADDGAT